MSNPASVFFKCAGSSSGMRHEPHLYQQNGHGPPHEHDEVAASLERMRQEQDAAELEAATVAAKERQQQVTTS